MKALLRSALRAQSVKPPLERIVIASLDNMGRINGVSQTFAGDAGGTAG